MGIRLRGCFAGIRHSTGQTMHQREDLGPVLREFEGNSLRLVRVVLQSKEYLKQSLPMSRVDVLKELLDHSRIEWSKDLPPLLGCEMEAKVCLVKKEIKRVWLTHRLRWGDPT